MKLVIINDVVYGYASGDPSANGGAERYQWLLARALAAAGWTVVVGVRRALKAGKRRTLAGVEFVGMGREPLPLAWFRFLSSERPDWWHWQCAYYWWGPAVEIAKLARVQTIFGAMHDRDVRLRHALYLRPQLWPLYAWGLMRTDRILVQHGEQLSQLPRQWQSKALILPGIVGCRAVTKPHCERAKYVAWVGMLGKFKRPDLLIEIARRLPSVRFVVCGGPLRFMSPPGYSEQILSELTTIPNIDYLGQVPPETALQVIAEASIFLSTSDEEGFPSVFLEALSAGTPVVTLKIDPDRMIERFGLGSVSHDIEGAMDDITSLLEFPRNRDRIAESAREYIATTHSEAAVVKAFEGAIRRFP